MKRLFTNQIGTMAELREPPKVLDAAGGKPVAIMKNSKCIGYLVPEAAVLQDEPRHATMDEVMAAFDETRAQAQPVLDCLKDK
jgi:antitoxin StbD